MNAAATARLSAVGAAVLAVPGLAHAQTGSPVGIFMDAAPLPKLVIASLLIAILAALAVCVMKLVSGPRLTGGSAFISGLRAGGPLVGCLGATYTVIGIFVGVANADASVPLKVVAPGIVEAVLMVALGLLSGVVAVIAHTMIDARIDRTVLRA